MIQQLVRLFKDNEAVSKVQRRLPYLFQMAELESSRAGKIGMQVGSLRETIISSFLVYRFGEKNVETDIPITEAEVDVKLYGNPVSIKTISGKEPKGVKLVWTVDPVKVREFMSVYKPSCDMILVHINWEGSGGLYYIPVETQKDVFDKVGREGYIKLPKPGTNPRGAELTNEALAALIENKDTKAIIVRWHKSTIKYSPYTRWVDLWRED